MTTNLAFVAIETTGLQAHRCPIWEIAIIVDNVEHCWQQRLPLWATPETTDYDVWTPAGRSHGLPINDGLDVDDPDRSLPIVNNWSIDFGMIDRYNDATAVYPAESAQRVRQLLAGRTVIVANPMFDIKRLVNLVMEWDLYLRTDTSWSECPVDIRSASIAPALHEWSEGPMTSPKPSATSTTRALAETLGIPTDDRHTALGDARLVKAMWERIAR